MNLSKILDITKCKPWHVALGFFFFYLFMIFRPSLYCDEGIWAYIGRAWAEHGILPYVGAVENKTPGIFYLYYIAHKLFHGDFTPFYFVRFLSISLISFSTLYIFRTTLLFTEKKSLGILSMIIYGFMMAWRETGDLAYSYTENFMVPFTAMGYFYLLRYVIKESFLKDIAFAGIMLGIAISFKQIAIVSLFGMIVVLLYRGWTKKVFEWRSVLLLSITSFLSVMVCTIPIFLSGISFGEYFDGAWLILLNSGSTGGVSEEYRIMNYALYLWNTRLFFVWVVMFLSLKQFKTNALFRFLFIIAFFDILAAILPGRMANHQLKQFVYPTILLIILLIDTYKVSHWLLLILIFFPSVNVLKSLNNLFYNFLGSGAVVLDRPLLTQPYDEYFELAKVIKNNTSKNDKVFIASGDHTILYFTERVSAGRYINYFFLTNDKAIEEHLQAVLKGMPKYYVKSELYNVDYPLISDWLSEHYIEKFRLAEHIVYTKVAD